MAKNILSAQSLTIAYQAVHQKKIILDNVSLNVKESTVTAIVGESGSGKTIFIKTLLDNLPEHIFVKEGCVFIPTHADQTINVLDSPPSIRKQLIQKQIGLITQNPAEALNPTMTIYKQLKEALFYGNIQNRMLRGSVVTKKIISVLQTVGISDYETVLHSYPYALSGGMCQRIMIAMMMLKEPRLLIADEPTTALDMVNQALIIKELLNLKERLHTTLLLITHDLALVLETADYVYVLKDGKVVEHGSTQKIYREAKHSYTTMLLQSIQKKKVVAAEREPPFAERKNSVQIEHLYKNYGTKPILQDISLTVKEGEIIAIIGESGSGKSTLARILSGIEEAASGRQQYFNGVDRSKKMFHSKENRQKVQIVFQNSFLAVNPVYSLYKILEEPLDNFFHLKSKEKHQAIEEILACVELHGIDTALKGRHLSGGQLQRVCLARALLAKPELLILDEFTSSLDMIIRHKILDTVKKLQRTHKFSVIFISHDLDSVLRLADRFYVMRHGNIVDEVTVSESVPLKNEYTKLLFDSMIQGIPNT